MSNIVTYEARFNTDDFTRGAQNIFTQVNQMNQVFNQTNTFIGSLGGSFGNAVVKFSNLTNVVNNVRDAFASFNKAGLDNEMQKMNMTTLFQGNAEAADEMFKKISEYGKATVYDKAGLIEAQKTMMSFGIEGEKAFSTLKQIGDIAMGDSGKMQSLSLAFAQVSSTGKLTGQDLMQMINAGFNPLQEMSRTTGISIGELKEKMADGAISADMVAQAFASATSEGGLFYEGAEKGGETMAGKVAQINDTIEEFKVKIFEATGGWTAYLSVAGDIATQLAPLFPLFDGIGKGAMSLVEKIGKKLLPAITANNVSLLAGGGLWKFFQKMGENACKGIGHAIKSIPIVGMIAAGITLVIGIVKLLWEKCEGFRVLVMGIWEVIKTGFMAVWEFVQPIFESWWNTIMGIIEFVQSIPEKVMAIVGAIKTKVKEVYNWLKTTIFGPIIDWFKNLYKNTVKPVIDKIVGLMADLFAPIIELWNKVTGKIVRAWNKGAAKGHESWKQDQEEKNKKEEEEKTENGILPTLPVEKPKPDKKLKSGNMGKSAGTAAGSARQVNITLTSLVGTMNFSGMTRENAASIEREVTELMARVLGMAETAV